MAQFTPNLNLKKWDLTDVFSNVDLNNNWDAIDNHAGSKIHIKYCTSTTRPNLSSPNDDGAIVIETDTGSVYKFFNNTFYRLQDRVIINYVKEGNLAVTSAPHLPVAMIRQNLKLNEIHVKVDTAPAGANLNFELLKNGVSILAFSIPAGQTSYSGYNINLDFVAGDTISLKVNQVGSTTAGSNLYMNLVF